MIIQKLIKTNTKRRPGLAILGVKFIVAHDTGNPNSTALGNVNYYVDSADLVEASVHTFIDDSNIVHCIPETEKAYHVRRVVDTDNTTYGADSIDYSLGIELCYFPQDKARSQKAYKSYCDHIKELCAKYHLDPTKHVVGHFTLDPTRKTDPMNAFKIIGKTWADFIKDITPSSTETTEEKKEKIIKLIREL